MVVYDDMIKKEMLIKDRSQHLTYLHVFVLSDPNSEVMI